VLSWPAAAQTLGQGGGTEIHWWRVLGALIVCIGLALGAAFALRRRLQLGPAANLFGANLFGIAPKLFGAPLPRRLLLVESLRLNHQVDVCVVRCDNQDYLLAVSPGGIVSLAGGPLPPVSGAVS
jgi:flagellar biogenesis protein FliO